MPSYNGTGHRERRRIFRRRRLGRRLSRHPYSSDVRIIVSRTDRIGDVVLTLPLCALLRAQLGAQVVALGRDYTRPLLEASPHVDEVLDWDAGSARDVDAQRKFLRDVRADAIVHVFPRADIARAALAAKIPLRIGTSHRWYHWLTCNALEHFSRKRSTLHEAQLDIRLARRLLVRDVPSLGELAALTALVPRAPVPLDIASRLRDDRFRLVLHPGSSGSAREWPLAHWKTLAESLDPAGKAVGSILDDRNAEWIERAALVTPGQILDVDDFRATSDM